MGRSAIIALFVCTTAAAQTPASRLPECSLPNLVGTYAVTYQGWLAVPVPNAPPTQIPGAIMGVQSISSTGAITGNVTAIFPSGKAVHELTPGSVVAVKPDCTGTLTLLPRKKGTSDTPLKETHRFVYLRESGELVTIMDEREGGVIPMMLGSWKRMASWPNAADW